MEIPILHSSGVFISFLSLADSSILHRYLDFYSIFINSFLFPILPFYCTFSYNYYQLNIFLNTFLSHNHQYQYQLKISLIFKTWYALMALLLIIEYFISFKMILVNHIFNWMDQYYKNINYYYFKSIYSKNSFLQIDTVAHLLLLVMSDQFIISYCFLLSCTSIFHLFLLSQLILFVNYFWFLFFYLKIRFCLNLQKLFLNFIS